MLAFHRQVKFELVGIHLVILSGSAFHQFDGAKLLGTPKVIDELDDIVVRDGSTFKFDIVALQRHPHKPDFERIQALTDMIEHFHRSGSALLQFIDDAILGFELFFLRFEVFDRLYLLFQLRNLCILPRLLVVLRLDFIIERGCVLPASGESDEEYANAQQRLRTHIPLRLGFSGLRSSCE
jgi:hypothetical protein